MNLFSQVEKFYNSSVQNTKLRKTINFVFVILKKKILFILGNLYSLLRLYYNRIIFKENPPSTFPLETVQFLWAKHYSAKVHILAQFNPTLFSGLKLFVQTISLLIQANFITRLKCKFGDNFTLINVHGAILCIAFGNAHYYINYTVLLTKA